MLRGIEGEIVMLNLLRFRETADRTSSPPPDERWDLVMLVRHRSAHTFLSFAEDEAYLEGMGHRLAAVADSRLLPVLPRP
ncbi:MAG: hypothetical protein ACE5GJ_06905 [Gemmatimonadota bacterium]